MNTIFLFVFGLWGVAVVGWCVNVWVWFTSPPFSELKNRAFEFILWFCGAVIVLTFILSYLADK